MRAFLLIFALLLPLTGIAKQSPKDILTALPQKIADCHRKNIGIIDEPGLGAYANYQQPGLKLTVYVYDLGHEKIGEALGDPVLKEAFQFSIAEVQEITRRGDYSDVQKLGIGPMKFGEGREVLSARYRLTRLTGDDAGKRFVSEIHVFGARGHIVKIRVTGKIEKEAEHAEAIGKFVPALMDSLRAPAGGK